MKITVLGTAAATGMPLTFCNCNVCKESRRLGGKNIRKRSSIVINDELLVDMGPDSINACCMYGIDVSQIKYLLQTHSHSDHFDAGHFVTRWSEYAVKDLQHLDIICSKGTAIDMNHWINENENIDLFDKKWQEDLNYSLNIIKDGEAINIGDYRIVAIDSKHDDRIEGLIYIISYQSKNILYATDLLEITDAAWSVFKNYRFDVVFFDQTYGKGYNAGGHPDAEMIVNYVKKMNEEKMIDKDSLVYGTHISHEGNDIHEKMEALATSNGYHIAYDGLIIEI